MNDEESNLILIVVDALRKDRVGVYEESLDDSLTPNIDTIAQEGAIFTNAFTTSNVTDASVTSMHTGHYPLATVYHHAELVTDSEQSRVEQVMTVPEQLRSAGWQTISVAPGLGRWHKNGFDFFGPEKTNLRKMYDEIKEISPVIANYGKRSFKYVNSVVNAWEFDGERGFPTPHIDQLIRHTDNNPFYGFLRLLDTHIPYTPSEKLVNELHGEREYPEQDLESLFKNVSEDGFLNSSVRPWLSQRDFETGLSRLCARYDASVVEADKKIGHLKQELQKRGQWENTTLIICGDHGESLYEHSIFMDHHGLYDETIHVPLIIKTPKAKKREYEQIVQLPDIAPTITDILGVDAKLGEFGKSLLPLLTEGEWDKREMVFAEEAYTQRRAAVRTNKWKFIQYTPDETLPTDGEECRYCKTVHEPSPELYNLSNDSGEQNNVSNSYPEVVERLGREYEGFIRSLPTLADEQEVEYQDEEEVLERLKELGYR